MTELKRMIEESDSPLERAVLEAGAYSRGGDGLRVKVLVSLGVATAVTTTSKTSLAMMASLKNIVLVGALGCVGAAGMVVGYRHYVSAPQGSEPQAVAAGTSKSSVQLASEQSGVTERVGSVGAGSLGARSGAAAAEPIRQDVTNPGAGNSGAGNSGAGNSGAGNSGAGKSGADALALGAERDSSSESRGSAEQPLPHHGATRAAHRDSTRGQRADGAGRDSAETAAPTSGSNTLSRAGARARVSAQPRGASREAAPEHAGAAAASERPQAERTVAPAASTPEPAAPPSSLEQEVAILDSARSALAAGRWGDALRHLDDHSVRFARGSLRLEAEVLRIEALASSGKTEEASRRAQVILRRSPNSVVASRLRRFVRE